MKPSEQAAATAREPPDEPIRTVFRNMRNATLWGGIHV
jgi:hypothetical protein